MKTKKILTAVFLIVLALFFVLAFAILSKKPSAAQQQMPAPTVTVAKPNKQDVLNYYEFTGQTDAVEEVEIRARVRGYLEKIHFADGADVKKGDLLFEIEQEYYIAKRDQAVAMVKSAQSELRRTKSDLKRIREAIEANAVSEQELTRSISQKNIAEAAVLAAKAALAEAKLNLGYTKIHSPIDGRIGKTMVDTGNLVGVAEPTLLTTVVRLEPIEIYFNVSEDIFLNQIQKNRSNEKSDHKCLIGLTGQEDYPYQGKLNFIDNTVDDSTGTITLRIVVPNKDHTILPGMFARVKLPVKTIKDTLLVLDKALGTDLGGKYLLLVNDKNIVKRRPVTTGQPVGDMRVITSGLKGDETYILEGLQFAYPQSEVNPVPQGQAPPQGMKPGMPSKGPVNQAEQKKENKK